MSINRFGRLTNARVAADAGVPADRRIARQNHPTSGHYRAFFVIMICTCRSEDVDGVVSLWMSAGLKVDAHANIGARWVVALGTHKP